MPYRDPDRQKRYQEDWRRKRREAKAEAPYPLVHGNRRFGAVRWIETYLKVPTGPLRGRPFKLGEWQRRFIRDALAARIREAGLSVARKNGKSGLIAAILLYYLRGPGARADWRGVVASLTGRLAVELRDAILATAEVSGIGLERVQTPYPGRVYSKAGPRLDILAADKATGHALGADLAVLDEAGLVEENQRPLWDALLSCVSGRNGRMVCISIQGDGPMFRELRGRRDDPAVCWHEYSTEPTEDFTDPAVWAKANPGLATGIKSREYMADMARRAALTPANQASFRAYDLNGPAAPNRELLVPMFQFLGAVVEKAPPRDGPCVVGFDLGGAASMTAGVVYWWETGRMEVSGAFPGVPDLDERGRADGVGNRYVRMHERGELRVYAGVRVTPAGLFLRDLLEDLAGCRIVAIVADRYRQAEAEDACADAGVLGLAAFRATSWRDAAHDVRAFQRAVISGHLKLEESLMLESAITESALATDPSGNQKLDKARMRGRIDAAAAAVLAVGEASVRAHLKTSRRYHGAV